MASNTVCSGFAVIDFDTTVFGDGPQRIVEIAVVHTDRHGAVTGLWETLVSPSKDLAEGSIEGLDPTPFASAPTLGQIAPELIGLLSGRVIIAHQARVHTGNLLSELGRVADELQLPALGTMQLAAEAMHGREERAADRCEEFSAGVAAGHHAIVDALATARLLAIHLRETDEQDYWGSLVDDSADLVWPPLSVVDVEWIARETGPEDPSGFLDRIATLDVDRSGAAAHAEYFALLDDCLRTPPLTLIAADRLVTMARRRRIGREMCEELHRAYFDDLVALAHSRGITASDMADLVIIGRDLSIPTYRIRASLCPARPVHELAPEWGPDGARQSDQLPDNGLNPAA